MERIIQWLGSKGLGAKDEESFCQWAQAINERLQNTPPPKLKGVPLDEVRFVVFDTETTGFNPKKGDELLSLGAVVFQHGKIQEETFHRYINPHRPVPPIVTDLTGITQEQADAGEDAALVIKDFLDFAGPCVLVGHSVNFDLTFVNHKLKRLNCCSLNQPCLDTHWLALALYPGYADFSLDGLLKLFQIEAKDRHTALGDAILTADVLSRLLAKLDRRRCSDFLDLQTFVHGQNWQQALTGYRNLIF